MAMPIGPKNPNTAGFTAAKKVMPLETMLTGSPLSTASKKPRPGNKPGAALEIKPAALLVAVSVFEMRGWDRP
jgi:hypothetical protein